MPARAPKSHQRQSKTVQKSLKNLGKSLVLCPRASVAVCWPPKPRTIGVQQQRRHQARVEPRLPEGAVVDADDLRQIKALARQGDHEMRKVVAWRIVGDRRRRQLRLIDLPGPKCSAHAEYGIIFHRNRPPLLGHAPRRWITRRVCAQCGAPAAWRESPQNSTAPSTTASSAIAAATEASANFMPPVPAVYPKFK